MSYFKHTKHAYLVLLALFGILLFIIVVGCYFNIRKRRRQIKAKQRMQEKKKNKKVKSDKQILTQEDELEQNHVATDQPQDEPPAYTSHEQGSIQLNNQVSTSSS